MDRRRSDTLSRFVHIAMLGFVAARCAAAEANDLSSDEEVVFFPTAAVLDPRAAQVTLPVHGWIYEPETNSLWRKAALERLVDALDLDDDVVTEKLFVERTQRFLVDNESDQDLLIRFGNREAPLSTSEANGHIRSMISISTTEARRWTTDGGRGPATFDYRLVTPRGDTRTFAGRIYLTEPEGWSIVSDVDDTIKDSNVLDKRELLRNTFVREFQAVPRMAAAYQRWQRDGAAFHYVTGSPWQLYPPLAEFLVRERFPGGSFQMRYFRLQDGSAAELLDAPDVYKRSAIEQLLKDFPERKFVLVGDTGEKDPEAYGAVAQRNPGRVRFIALRNITDARIDDERMREALGDFPAERVLLFDDPASLPELKDLPAN